MPFQLSTEKVSREKIEYSLGPEDIHLAIRQFLSKKGICLEDVSVKIEYGTGGASIVRTLKKEFQG